MAARKPRGKLDLDPVTVRKARSLARKAGKPIVTIAQKHTTISVERATLRLAGLAGADGDGIPWANRLADVVRADVGLEHGVALPVWDALVRGAPWASYRPRPRPRCCASPVWPTTSWSRTPATRSPSGRR